MIKSLFGRSQPVPAIPDGERVYAIGDVHGRLDCFDLLLDQIARDDLRRGPATSRLILLGDLIDRGSDSCGVVERAIELAQGGSALVQLMGNHEELLLKTLDGERSAASVFDRSGGRNTLLSYGVSEEEYDHAPLSEIGALIARYVPPHHLAFLREGQTMACVGDYAFVHAGIRPKVPLDAQKAGDLRWIREPFLSYQGWHGIMVVHGHTITVEADVRSNRIGIDTGAFETGRLTALGLQGTNRWFLTATA